MSSDTCLILQLVYIVPQDHMNEYTSKAMKESDFISHLWVGFEQDLMPHCLKYLIDDSA